MEFRILGPLEVVEDGEPVALGTLKERLVLAVLLLHANEVVSAERLIDELWGVAPPPTARKAVHVYVSKLRKTLGGDGHDPITTADGGYRLLVDPDRFDADRMRRLVAGARGRMADGESERASRLLREALAFWRGPTLAGLTLESVGRDEVAQLDELRITSLMDRIDCDLAQGGHEHVLGELQVLVREHPLRERLRGQQMLALYRADRQADALDTYQQARHELMDELGIEPSESLQRLQQAILRHDPTLEAPAGTAASNGAGAAPAPSAAAAAVPPTRLSRPRRPGVRRRYLIVAVLASLVVVAAAAAFLSTRGSGREPPSSRVSYVSPDTVAIVDAATGKLVGDPGAGGGSKPGPIAVAGKAVWIGGRGNAQIELTDVPAARETAPFSVATRLDDLVTDPAGHAWVSDRRPVVTWIGHVTYGSNPYAVPVVSEQNVRVHLPGAGAEAVGGGYLWVISDLPGRFGTSVALVDVRHRSLASTIPLGLQTTAIAYGFGSAWIGAYDPETTTASLLRVGSGSARRESVWQEHDGAGPFAIAVGAGSVWVVTSRGSLIRLDPEKPQVVAHIPMSVEQPTVLAVGAGSVWTGNHNDSSVSQIDPHKNKVVRTIPLGSYDSVPCGIAATHRTVLVAIGETSCS